MLRHVLADWGWLHRRGLFSPGWRPSLWRPFRGELAAVLGGWLTLVLVAAARLITAGVLPVQLVLALAAGFTVGAALLVMFGVPGPADGLSRGGSGPARRWRAC